MQLSNDQIKGKEIINTFLNNSDDKMFILTGSAGTGKTTLITNILNSSIYNKKKIALCATTHKAVSVLKNIELENNSLTYITIHKLLKIKRKIDKEGKEIFTTDIEKHNELKKETKSIYYFDIIIIDECSMIDKDLLKVILGIQGKIRGKIIFIGDICQLPPVNEKNSSIFSYKFPSYELKEIMRYKGNIVELCNDIRKLIFNNKFKLKLNKYKSKNINYYKNTNDFVEKFVKTFKNVEKKDEKEYPICISYTNKKCNIINNSIRNKLFSNTENKFVKGELIIFNNFYNTGEKVYYTSQKEIILEIDEESYSINNFDIVIRKILDKKIEKYFELIELGEYEKNSIIIIKMKLLEKMQLLFKKIDNFSIDIYKITLTNKDKLLCLKETELEKYDNFIELCKKMIRKIVNWLNNTIKILGDYKTIYKSFINLFWELYYEKFIDKFCDIDYGYCITTHKSQASTFSRIFVDMDNIINHNSKLDESYRCLYTAITRTSKKLNILL